MEAIIRHTDPVTERVKALDLTATSYGDERLLSLIRDVLAGGQGTITICTPLRELTWAAQRADEE